MSEVVIPHMGFLNTGSICYFNALVQCLLSSSTFLQFMIGKSRNSFFLEFFESINNGQWDTIFTTRLLQLHNMVRPNQSSSEYFLFFVDALHLEPIFETTYSLVRTCSGCGNVNFSKDKAYTTMIDREFKEYFRTEEKLESVKCDACKRACDMQRIRTVEGIPPVIAMNFNKYYDKRDIQYPEQFNVDSVRYRLIGTIEHFGVLGAGHYVARYFRNDQYALADDASVRPLSKLDVSQNTYMVFYERQTV